MDAVESSVGGAPTSGLDVLAANLLLFAGVTVASSWIPAARAARSRPARVLREE